METGFTRRRLTDREAGTVLASLRAWEPSAGCGWQLQAGDLGWALRFEPAIRDEQIRVWWDATGRCAAVILCDQPGSARCAVNPAYLHDSTLADAVLADLSRRLDRAGGGPWIDPPPGPGALTRALLAAGYEPDPDIWLHLWRPLPGAVAEPPAEPTVRAFRPADAAQRVAVQHAAFPGSSLTPERYQRLRAVPDYRAELDLVGTVDDRITAFCLAWLGPPGGTALLEPAGTHPGHRRRGHASAVIAEAFRRLARLGATGVAVLTPVSNRPAVALYRALGFTAVAERRSYWPAPP
ncbi:N-acetyltransferase [Actinocatenispora sera]|uniref:GNAT family N-acetyltransferase n=1 Tax=Actinocatenispora sera TaxID=390989 RepID=UPI0033C29108